MFCSFEGGIGAGSGVEALWPRGPNGPRSSSRDSRRDDCTSILRGVRGVLGPRVAGDCGFVEEDGREVGGLDLDLSVACEPLQAIVRFVAHQFPLSR